MRLFAVLMLLAAPALAETCPPPPDMEPENSTLLVAVRAAPDEQVARKITNEIWALWARAPDGYAQELLDEGMQRRAAYDFAGAVTAFDALIAYCPEYAEGWNQRAFVHFIRQDYAAALADLDRAIALRPRHFAALTGKALSLMALGDLEGGQMALRAALDLNPWLPERHMLIPLPGKDL